SLPGLLKAMLSAKNAEKQSSRHNIGPSRNLRAAKSGLFAFENTEKGANPTRFAPQETQTQEFALSR
ncbi:hypothetical protein, partial [Agrobacterium albertimagni]|uniref:hypothetical protein n=1 Tax=Agrobacterium albertimagni TaxID=147266 RepID=UPI001AEBE4F4